MLASPAKPLLSRTTRINTMKNVKERLLDAKRLAELIRPEDGKMMILLRAKQFSNRLED